MFKWICSFVVGFLPLSLTFTCITHIHTFRQIEIFPGGLAGPTEIDLILNQDGERETLGDSAPSLPAVAASSYSTKKEKVERLAAANNM